MVTVVQGNEEDITLRIKAHTIKLKDSKKALVKIASWNNNNGIFTFCYLFLKKY